MSIRATLLANLSTSLTGSNVTVSSELPFEAGGIRLYDKNMKKLYLSYDRTAMTEMFSTLNPNNDVYQKEITLNAYFTVDAKNQPSDIDTVVSKVLNSRLSVANCFVNECTVSNDTFDDRITYTFEYRFLTL